MSTSSFIQPQRAMASSGEHFELKTTSMVKPPVLSLSVKPTVTTSSAGVTSSRRIRGSVDIDPVSLHRNAPEAFPGSRPEGFPSARTSGGTSGLLGRRIHNKVKSGVDSYRQYTGHAK